MSGLTIVAGPADGIASRLAARLEPPVLRLDGVCEAARRDALQAAERAGAVRLLVCEPMPTAAVPVDDLDAAAAEHALDDAFDGPVALTLVLWPLLRAGHGSVVVISSPLGLLASVRDTGRSAAEHALVAWSRALAAAARSEGVHVLTVHAQARAAGERDAAAAAVQAALAARRHECYSPRTLRARAAVQAVLPGSLGRVLATRA